jgi:putative peptidoglycan binding protein
VPEIYNGFSLCSGDNDGVLRFGGSIRTPAEAGAGHHVETLREDLVRLGFFLAREGDIAKRGIFDRWLEEAVREFQVMARLPTVARERIEPKRDAYLLRLESVNVADEQRYPQASAANSETFASGVVNATTRRLIELWTTNKWRCPWVIAEWAVPGKKPKKTLLKRPPKAAQAVEYKVGHRTLVRADLTVTGRTPKIQGEVFLHDFAGCYLQDANPAQPDPRLYLGKERSYLARRGPSAWSSSDRAVTAAQIAVTPETLTGADIDDLDSAAASTFRVVGAVARIEVTTGLQMVNAYDLACQSAGLYHFALVTPAPRPAVGKGELGGVFSLLEKRSAEEFNNFIANFGLRHELPWGEDGSQLKNRSSGVWETYSCREAASGVRGERIVKRDQADVLQSWQWLARLNMLAFVSPAYRQVLWTLACMRLEAIQSLKIGGQFPNQWTLGSVFSSELLMAKLLRIHVRQSGALGTLPDVNEPPLCEKWVREVMKVLTPQEIAAGPSKWDGAVLARLDARINARFPGYSKDTYDKNNKLIKQGDFNRIAQWRWKERALSSAPRSFKLVAAEA